MGCALRAGTGATVEATALVPNVRERDKPQFVNDSFKKRSLFKKSAIKILITLYFFIETPLKRLIKLAVNNLTLNKT